MTRSGSTLLRPALLVLVAALAACRSERGEGEVPAMLRYQFETQMKTILHDVRLAEEQAQALEGTYLGLERLRGQYLSREVSDKYRLTITDASSRGFRAEVVHLASGLSCRLEVGEGPGGPGRGVPVCD